MLKQGDPEECNEAMQKEICKGDGTCENEDEVTICLYSSTRFFCVTDWTFTSGLGVLNVLGGPYFIFAQF